MLLYLNCFVGPKGVKKVTSYSSCYFFLANPPPPTFPQSSMCGIGCVSLKETAVLMTDSGHGDKLQSFGDFTLLESSGM